VFDPTQYDNANNTHHGNGQTSQPNSNARQYAQGSNVYHDPRMGRNASSGTSSHQNIASDTHTNFANPGEADYLPHLSATRQRFIDQEASAVRIRDYPVASRSAKILQRLVEIEEGLMTHETQEMEASLAQDYGTAAVAKRRKDVCFRNSMTCGSTSTTRRSTRMRGWWAAARALEEEERERCARRLW